MIENAKKIILRYYSRERFMHDISVTFSLVKSINLLRQKEKKEKRGKKKEIKGDRKAFCKANEGGNERCVFA